MLVSGRVNDIKCVFTYVFPLLSEVFQVAHMWSFPGGYLAHTVDGRNPTPPGICKTPVNNGISTTNLNWWVYRISGCHQQYLTIPVACYLSLPLFPSVPRFWKTTKRRDTAAAPALMAPMAPARLAAPGVAAPRGRAAWELWVTSQGIMTGQPTPLTYPPEIRLGLIKPLFLGGVRCGGVGWPVMKGWQSLRGPSKGNGMEMHIRCWFWSRLGDDPFEKWWFLPCWANTIKGPRLLKKQDC